jgi:hypothetical protein
MTYGVGDPLRTDRKPVVEIQQKGYVSNELGVKYYYVSRGTILSHSWPQLGGNWWTSSDRIEST